MFKFIKSLFKEEVKIEKIVVDDIHLWFEKKAEETQKEIDKKIIDLKTEIQEKINNTKTSLETLETAELRNKNIPVREKQFMDGNKKQYLQRTQHFLRELEDILQKDLTFFLPHYEEYLKNFSKSTARSYRILQEFLANEAREIALRIKEVDDSIAKLKQDKDIHKHKQIDTIKKDIEHIKNYESKKAELEKNHKNLKQELEKLNEKHTNTKKSKKEIEESKEHKEVEDNIKEKEKNEKKLKIIVSSFYDDFSILKRPLKKYQRIAFKHDNLVEKYHEDALNALITDINLNIIEIFDGIQKNIDKLSLKDKISSKSLKIIKSMDKSYFKNFLDKYSKLVTEIEEITNKIEKNKAKKELEKLEEDLNYVTQKKQTIQQRIDQIKNELDSTDINHLKEKVKKKVEEVFQIEIELK